MKSEWRPQSHRFVIGMAGVLHQILFPLFVGQQSKVRSLCKKIMAYSEVYSGQNDYQTRALGRSKYNYTSNWDSWKTLWRRLTKQWWFPVFTRNLSEHYRAKTEIGDICWLTDPHNYETFSVLKHFNCSEVIQDG